MAKVETIEGVGEVYLRKFQEVSIETTEELLEKGASPEGRRELAKQTGISERLILEWVNYADLLRIKGIGEEYADLLEATGVDCVVELAKCDPARLYKRMVDTNERIHLVRRLPTFGIVAQWVEQASASPLIVSY